LSKIYIESIKFHLKASVLLVQQSKKRKCSDWPVDWNTKLKNFVFIPLLLMKTCACSWGINTTAQPLAFVKGFDEEQVIFW